jgi:hypothetical protein
MVQVILANGLMTYNMDMVYKNGMMVLHMKESTIKVPNMEQVNLIGLMVLYIKEILKKI